MIPSAVAGELSRRPEAPGSGTPSPGFVEVLDPDPEDACRVASGSPTGSAGRSRSPCEGASPQLWTTGSIARIADVVYNIV